MAGMVLILFASGCKDKGEDAAVTDPLLSSSNGRTLAMQKNCIGCHAVDHKIQGPAFKDVAAKYAGQKNAPEKLANKVREGGSGVWGVMPMPLNPQVNTSEAETLVQWILSGAG